MIVLIAVLLGVVAQNWKAQYADTVGQYKGIILGGVVFVVLALLWAGYTQKSAWIGPAQSSIPKDDKHDVQRAKALWDWTSPHSAGPRDNFDLARYPTAVGVVCPSRCARWAGVGLPHRRAHPLRAPAVSPPVMNRWKMRNKTTIGILLIRLAPISWFQ